MARVLLSVLLIVAVLVLLGCSTEPRSESVSGPTTEPYSTSSQSVPLSGATVSTAAPAVPSFDEAWAASLAALDALGPTRVSIIETTQGRLTGEGVPPEQSAYGPQSERVEQLFDVAGRRARLTEHTSDRIVKTTVVRGRERTSTITQPMTHSDWVSVSRYFSLEAPQGLPMPLWAGSAVGPNEGYADLLKDLEGGAGGMASARTVEPREDGGLRLSWERSADGVTSALSLLLNPDRLPVRIEIAGKGTPTEGDLQGLTVEYSTVIDYKYERVASFSDSDFALDIPADAFREGVTYELALDRPWSDRADWGQYWLGAQVEEWPLTRAEYAIHEGDADLGGDAEPGDEGIFLFYDRPGAISPNESIQVMVRPLRGRYYEDSLSFAEERAASGDWVREEVSVAGRPATVYPGALEGGADDRIDSIYVYLPDAWVHIQVWAPVDPRLVLEALRPVE